MFAECNESMGGDKDMAGRGSFVRVPAFPPAVRYVKLDRMSTAMDAIDECVLSEQIFLLTPDVLPFPPSSLTPSLPRLQRHHHQPQFSGHDHTIPQCPASGSASFVKIGTLSVEVPESVLFFYLTEPSRARVPSHTPIVVLVFSFATLGRSVVDNHYILLSLCVFLLPSHPSCKVRVSFGLKGGQPCISQCELTDLTSPPLPSPPNSSLTLLPTGPKKSTGSPPTPKTATTTPTSPSKSATASSSTSLPAARRRQSQNPPPLPAPPKSTTNPPRVTAPAIATNTTPSPAPTKKKNQPGMPATAAARPGRVTTMPSIPSSVGRGSGRVCVAGVGFIGGRGWRRL